MSVLARILGWILFLLGLGGLYLGIDENAARMLIPGGSGLEQAARPVAIMLAIGLISNGILIACIGEIAWNTKDLRRS